MRPAVKVARIAGASRHSWLETEPSGGANPHNSFMSAFPHFQSIFRINRKNCLLLVIKQLLFVLTNIKAKEIDYFEAVFLLNNNENMPPHSQAIFNLQAFHASFGDEPRY